MNGKQVFQSIRQISEDVFFECGISRQANKNFTYIRASAAKLAPICHEDEANKRSGY